MSRCIITNHKDLSDFMFAASRIFRIRCCCNRILSDPQVGRDCERGCLLWWICEICWWGEFADSMGEPLTARKAAAIVGVQQMFANGIGGCCLGMVEQSEQCCVFT